MDPTVIGMANIKTNLREVATSFVLLLSRSLGYKAYERKKE
jgi:hypothetical protein